MGADDASRTKTLFEAGASSQAEMDQAQTALSTARAQLEAAEAQVRQQRVALDYHLVSSPTAGVVGDVPVRVGDSVTRSTVLTTIDQNAGLEIYVNVPVQEAGRLRLGLPVRLLDDAGGQISSTRLSFVAPSVDAGSVKLLSGKDDLATYEFNTRVAKHHFCKVCGIHPFYVPRSDPDKIDVNARCLDDFDEAAIAPKRFDGRNWEAAMEKKVPWR